MKKEKTLFIEKHIVSVLKIKLNNPKFKIENLLEWWADEETAKKNTREDEIYVRIESAGVYAIIKKELDKR